MKYDTADAAVVYQSVENNLIVLDKDGKTLVSEKTTAAQWQKEAARLTATRQFRQAGKFNIMINLDHVGTAAAYIENDQKIFQLRNFEDMEILRFNLQPQTDLASCVDSLWAGNAFAELPGHFEAINYRMMSKIQLKDNFTIDFYGRDDRVFATSLPLSPGVAGVLIPRMQLAIAAAKARANPDRKKSAPARDVEAEEENRLRQLPQTLKSRIFDQDEAADALSTAVRRARAGLNDPDKPMGSFLFHGPTGVGKTDLARELAAALKMDFKKFDMSEYMEKHTVSRLIGSPPGYVGHDEGGQLVDWALQHPNSVIVLDEIEKAHEDIYNVLLQVFEDGALTDGKGRTAKFNNTIVIMTSNIGVGAKQARKMGFAQKDDPESVEKDARKDDAVMTCFRPEFINRLTEVIKFKPLTLEAMTKIVGKFLATLEDRLKAKNITINVSPEAMGHLLEKGFDPVFGARPLDRVIQKAIADPVADETLFGRLKNGGKVTVGIHNNALSFDFQGSLLPKQANDAGLEEVPRKNQTRTGTPPAP